VAPDWGCAEAVEDNRGEPKHSGTGRP
jgi:hypothetical protein